jgi:hypothetical protein
VPDIVRLRWLGADAQHIPVINGVAESATVEPDSIFDLPGRVIESDKELAKLGLDPALHTDAIVVEFGNPPVIRAFPTSLYRNETASKSKAKE